MFFVTRCYRITTINKLILKKVKVNFLFLPLTQQTLSLETATVHSILTRMTDHCQHEWIPLRHLPKTTSHTKENVLFLFVTLHLCNWNNTGICSQFRKQNGEINITISHKLPFGQ